MIRRSRLFSNFLFLVTIATVMAQPVVAQNCGLRLEVTAIDKHLIGTLRTQSGAVCTNADVKWYNNKKWRCVYAQLHFL